MSHSPVRSRGTWQSNALVALELALIGVLVLVASAVMTGFVRRIALARGLLDVPNARSSHSVVTPRGGGISMVFAIASASLVLLVLGELSLDLFAALIGGGSAVAAIGFMDDRRPVPAKLRLAVHIGAAIWAVGWLGIPLTLRVGDHILHPGWMGGLFAVLAIVWTLNLFNFMDGIDGIAASEAAFVGCTGALLMLMGGAAAGVAAVGLVVAAACCGFLLWNWPPARIFMGDVGSGYLGYLFGVLALAAARESPTALWIWLVLGGVFFVDATVTLIRRTVRCDRVFDAHRTHAYQWLARRWGGHLPVTLTFMGINLFWLLPWALLATRNAGWAAWIALIALLPLVLVMIALGAGRAENRL